MRAAACLAAVLAIAAWSDSGAGSRSDFPGRLPARAGASAGNGAQPQFRGIRRRRQRRRHSSRRAAARGLRSAGQVHGSGRADKTGDRRRHARADRNSASARAFFSAAGKQSAMCLTANGSWSQPRPILPLWSPSRSAIRTRPIPKKPCAMRWRRLRRARSVPDAERLSLLPFKVGDLAGFHIEDVLPGRALMLADTGTEQGTAASGAAAKTAAEPRPSPPRRRQTRTTRA